MMGVLGGEAACRMMSTLPPNPLNLLSEVAGKTEEMNESDVMSDLSDLSEEDEAVAECYVAPEFFAYPMHEERLTNEVVAQNVSAHRRRDMAATLEWACGHSLSPEARWSDALLPLFFLYESVSSHPNATRPLARSTAWRVCRILEGDPHRQGSLRGGRGPCRVFSRRRGGPGAPSG